MSLSDEYAAYRQLRRRLTHPIPSGQGRRWDRPVPAIPPAKPLRTVPVWMVGLACALGLSALGGWELAAYWEAGRHRAVSQSSRVGTGMSLPMVSLDDRPGQGIVIKENVVEFSQQAGVAIHTGTIGGNGVQVYCVDCALADGPNHPCVAGGTGAIAQNIDGLWQCLHESLPPAVVAIDTGTVGGVSISNNTLTVHGRKERTP